MIICGHTSGTLHPCLGPEACRQQLAGDKATHTALLARFDPLEFNSLLILNEKYAGSKDSERPMQLFFPPFLQTTLSSLLHQTILKWEECGITEKTGGFLL